MWKALERREEEGLSDGNLNGIMWIWNYTLRRTKIYCRAQYRNREAGTCSSRGRYEVRGNIYILAFNFAK
jgi:hypothetical protein